MEFGHQEVAFCTHVAAQMSAPLVPRCCDAVWDADRNNRHLLLDDLTNSHFTLASWPMPPTLEQSEHFGCGPRFGAVPLEIRLTLSA
ncbi:MAG: hypothetical protein JO320_26995 [Alphaproteobacteria bacterium]|nr:hypothetical protein [Alphaproteobacteria bacterium]MBV9378653.1 hypothetical protein [Alphaproteobacteria bacterium]